LKRLAIAATVSCLGFGACGSPPRPPNIVFILIDDLGWRDVGFMGSEYYETPHIDALAGQGMAFTSAYANGPNCAPSRASLMSGQYTPRHGIYTVAPAARGQARNRKLLVDETETTLDLEIVTIAEALRSAGYATASVGKWHLGAGDYLPQNQGFDVNVGGNARGSPPSHFWPYERQTARGAALAIEDLREGGAEGEYLADRLTDEALAWIDANADEPFFLYMTHYAVHTPIQAKPAVIDKYAGKAGSQGHDNPRYAAMVESADDSVGRILARLDELGLADDTVVFFFSDNGGLGRVTSMAPLRGSKGMLYEGGIREPLIVRWPGRVEAGRTSDVPVTGVDFYPTLLEMAGADAPAGQVLDGLSLLPLLTGGRVEEALQARPLFWHFPAYLEGGANGPWRTTPAAAVRQGDFKLIEFFEDGSLELYNLRDDLGEQHNRAGDMPDEVQELHDLMLAWRETVGAPVPTAQNPDYDPGDR
jgi:arylsulfatase A-like enzyme